MAVSDFERFWRHAVGLVPTVDPLIAQRLAHKGWERISEAHDDWSFLTRHTLISTAAEIVAGTVSVTKGSANVVVDATAKAALDAVDADDLVGRSFRTGLTIGAGNYHEILSYDTGTSTIVLEIPWQLTTAVGQTYVVTNRLIDAPTDFKVWRSVIDNFNSRTIKVFTIRPRVDQADPQRTSTDDPYWLVPHEPNRTTGLFQYEWYPAPRQALTYDAIYLVASDLDDSWVKPVHFEWQFLHRALMCECYEWAEANRGANEQLKGADWRFLLDRTESKFKDQLQRSHLQDLNLSGNNIGIPYTSTEIGGPGANYYQNHAPFRAG